MGGTHALADEIRWMLKEERYEDLNARIRFEMKRAVWRGMGRKPFLEWCSQDNERRRTAGEVGSSSSDQESHQPFGERKLAKDKPLSRLSFKLRGSSPI